MSARSRTSTRRQQSQRILEDQEGCKMECILPGIEAIHVAAVLEDTVDQLAILGKIMPGSYEDKPEAEEMVQEELQMLVEGQRNLENKYEDVMNQRKDLKGDMKSLTDKRAQNTKEGANVGSDLKNNTHVFARTLRQNPLTADNLEKTQADRAFLHKVLFGTLFEMSANGGFSTLVNAVKLEKEKKAQLQETILKEENGRKRVKTLQKQLAEVRKEKEVEIHNRNEMIAHLKDQLQELKAKTNMEGKYIKKMAEVSVAQTQKKCTLSEAALKEEIEKIRVKLDEEIRVNSEIEAYLKTHQTELESKVEYWMEKYDKDVEAKQHELDVLKASKAKDLERLQELTKLYGEYEQVVVEERITKEKARRKAEMEAEELRAAVRIQSWFRGIMVRKGLGGYGKKKKKKGKKGKKGKK